MKYTDTDYIWSCVRCNEWNDGLLNIVYWNTVNIQVGFHSLEGREEDTRPENGLSGPKYGDGKLISGDWDKKSLDWEMYAKE